MKHIQYFMLIAVVRGVIPGEVVRSDMLQEVARSAMEVLMVCLEWNTGRDTVRSSSYTPFFFNIA